MFTPVGQNRPALRVPGGPYPTSPTSGALGCAGAATPAAAGQETPSPPPRPPPRTDRLCGSLGQAAQAVLEVVGLYYHTASRRPRKRQLREARQEAELSGTGRPALPAFSAAETPEPHLCCILRGSTRADDQSEILPRVEILPSGSQRAGPTSAPRTAHAHTRALPGAFLGGFILGSSYSEHYGPAFAVGLTPG